MAEEARIEKRIKRKIRQRGGWCLKWVSPMTRGVPDDIVFPGDGTVHFLEVKSPGKNPRPEQRVVHAGLARLGIKVHVVDSDEAAEKFLDEIYPERK